MNKKLEHGKGCKPHVANSDMYILLLYLWWQRAGGELQLLGRTCVMSPFWSICLCVDDQIWH